MVDHLGKEELHHLTARGVSEGRRGVRVRVSEVCVRGWGDGVSGGGACRYITVTLPSGGGALHYRYITERRRGVCGAAIAPAHGESTRCFGMCTTHPNMMYMLGHGWCGHPN